MLRRVLNPGKLATAIAATGHNIFNPIQWKKKADGTPVPSELFGLSSLSLTNISPLQMRIQYRGSRDTGENLRFDFLITREAATNSTARGPVPRVLGLGGKIDLFTVKDVKGPKDAPTGVVLELAESRQTVTVSREKPYEETEGYMADLRYDAENKSFLRQRIGQKLSFAGETYNIIAIGPVDVTLEDNRTKKRTTIGLKAAP